MIHSLSASDLLDLSERGAGCLPVEQALLLLHAAAPGLPADELARLPLGQRDAILLELRQRTFGGHINGLVACPVCRERVELDFEIGDLLASFPGYSWQAVLPAELPALNFSEAGYEITFRLPASADLLAVSQAVDLQAARLGLLNNCLIETKYAGEKLLPADLPDGVVQSLAAELEKADPLALINIPLACLACGHTWDTLFDIASFFWAEVNLWALRLMSEVHILASAYGWREADILAMSAWRRHKYLEIIGV